MTAEVVEPSDVELTLGDGPIADELRSLGLPALPNFASWGEDRHGTFQLGRKV